MSDGNFNRQLLPKTELSSGLRAGKAQMRAKALDAFPAIINKYYPEISQDRLAEMKVDFADMLRI